MHSNLYTSYLALFNKVAFLSGTHPVQGAGPGSNTLNRSMLNSSSECFFTQRSLILI